jgi:hypothetical protein
MERETSCYYQFPSPARLEADRGAAALLELAASAATPSASNPEEVVGALALIGEAPGVPAEMAPQISEMPRTPSELWGLSVEARRRGAVLVVKRNKEFRIVRLLEIRESTALWLLERARISGEPGAVEAVVIRVLADPNKEHGLRVQAMPNSEVMRMSLRDLENPPMPCSCVQAHPGAP